MVKIMKIVIRGAEAKQLKEQCQEILQSITLERIEPEVKLSDTTLDVSLGIAIAALIFTIPSGILAARELLNKKKVKREVEILCAQLRTHKCKAQIELATGEKFELKTETVDKFIHIVSPSEVSSDK